MADDSSLAKVISDDTFDVLEGEYDGTDPRNVTLRYIRRRSAEAIERWKRDFEDRTTATEINTYQRRLRRQFVDAIGGLPERSPLNPTVVEGIPCDGYHVETVRFESQPNHHVTGTLYLPDVAEFNPPYPAVVVSCGHSQKAKAHEVYAQVGALLARNGLAGFVFDPICQGERYQRIEDGVPWDRPTTEGHMFLGIGSIPLGRNVARFEIFDAMCVVDYLQSREDIDGDRIGATGISGGGTQTAYLAALDDRIVAAAPGCWITSIEALLEERVAEDAEQNIHGQLSFGLDHADLLMMRAPAPTLVLAATDDFFDIGGTWDSVRTAKRLYGRLGYPDRLDIVEVEDEHGFSRLLRETAVAWMARWLRGEHRNVIEPRNFCGLAREAIQSTPTGQVLRLDGERSVYELNEEYADTLVEERERRWQSEPVAALDEVRDIAGVRPLADLPEPSVKRLDVTQGDEYEIERLVFEVEDCIPLPAVRLIPAEASGPPVVCVHEDGKRAAVETMRVNALVDDGREVLVVDLRGTGETTPEGDGWIWGPDWDEVFAAYRLGRSYVGMRAEDVLVSARWLRDQSQSESVCLQAIGHVGIAALHAAALEPELFEEVFLSRMLQSWESLIRNPGTKTSFANLVHGALLVYDLPDLAGTLGDTVTIENTRATGS